MEYYDDEWHDIREQWVEGLKGFNFLTSTNNRVERMNKELKSIITENSTINQFFKDLMSLLSSLSFEKEHKEITMLQKVCIIYIFKYRSNSLYIFVN